MSNKTVSETIALIEQSCIDKEYGDIRSMLDEYADYPLWCEQVTLIGYLTQNLTGASFEYSTDIGWSYVEEGE